MDEHNELPDDLSQWPESNWELFNLDSQNATYNDLRRAYSRLIKLFRPETRPEHFQRIQEAFEALRDLIQSDKTANPNKQDSDSENEKAVQQRRSRRQKEFLDKLYDQYIVNADWDNAIKFLESVISPDNPTKERRQEISDLDELPYLYMFWLMYTINSPKEDAFSKYYKYLIMGENAHDDNEMSISIKTFLYFMERKLYSNTDKIYDYALNNIDFPAIIYLVNVRWINLRFEEDVDDVVVILSDLEILKKRFAQSDARKWVNVNIEAIEHLHWINTSSAKDAIESCMNTIMQYPEYSFDKRLDYIDRLEQMIDSLNSIPKILPVDIDAIQTLLLLAGNSVFSRYRRLLLKFVSDLADDVLKAFMVFDYLNTYHSLVAFRLYEPLHQLYLSRHDENDQPADEFFDNVTTKILDIWESHNQNYNACKLPLLKLFLEEQFDPASLSNFISEKLNNNQEDANLDPKDEKLKKWHSEFVTDGSVVLTYYTIMCCELNGMEDYEDDEDEEDNDNN